MYPTELVEQALHLKIGDKKPAEYHPAQPWDDDFAEGGSFRHVGRGSKIAEKMNAEERARAGFKARS
jgi:hypothetical protein